MSEYFESKKKGHYKRRCHELIDEIWGSDKKGMAAAYTWLNNNFGGDVHFSKLNNEKKLKEIYEAMWLLSFHPPEKGEKILSFKEQKKEKLASIKKKYTDYRTNVFTDKELLREIGRRNTLKVMPWYKKIINYFNPSLNT